MTNSASNLFQSHPDPSWMCDPETLRVLAVNHAACDRYGYSQAEFLGMTLHELTHPAPSGEQALPADSPIEWHRSRDDTVLPVVVRSRDLDHEGRRVRLVTAVDATRLAALERENREVKALLEARKGPYRLATRLLGTLQGISDGLFTLDREGRFTFVNREAERLLRRRAAALLGHRLVDALPEASGSTFEQHCLSAMASGQAAAFEAYFAPFHCWFDVRAYPSAEELVVYFHDISAVRTQRDQLQLLESAVSRLNDMIMITEAGPLDEPGPRIIYVNDALTERTGYRRDEVIGRSPRLFQGPGTQRGELDRIREALEAQRPVRAELVNYTKQGKAFRVEMEIVPVIDQEGRHTHFVSVQRDVTEQRELEEQLQRSQRLDAIGQLTGGIAHDFNNLLTVILGNADLLAHELAGDERLHTLARMTRTAAERGAELTRRLLAFARRQALDPSLTDVNELLNGMYGLLCRTLGEHIEIELRPGRAPGKVMVDAPQLESAVLNLCINARDAMPDGGRLILETGSVQLGDDDRIHQGEVVPGDYVTITVSDTGTGMPQEIVEHAFEPFFTTKETGKGSGLGLSMVYGFIKQSAGHIKIHSEPDRGTSVTLYLPRATAPAAEVGAVGAAADMVGGSERILLVEDDDIVRSFVGAELEALGYQVVSVGDGRRAMDALRRQGDFDLLFTDIIMPGGMNGRELADAARALYPHLPVLFTSGYTEDAIVDHGRLEGVQLLHKPYRRAELAAKVRQVLARPKP